MLGNAAVDLESFASHGGRTTIKVEDVMLLARRNEGLEQILKDAAKNLGKEKSKKKSSN